MRKRLPFELLVIDSDGESKFINAHLLSHREKVLSPNIPVLLFAEEQNDLMHYFSETIK